MQGLEWPARTVVGVVTVALPDGGQLPALEYGYDGWECPRCGEVLGSCSGPAAVQSGQACGCGARVCDVIRVPLLAAEY